MHLVQIAVPTLIVKETAPQQLKVTPYRWLSSLTED